MFIIEFIEYYNVNVVRNKFRYYIFCFNRGYFYGEFYN